MHPVDIGIIVAYMVGLLVLGAVLARGQTTSEAFFVGERRMSSNHLGLSIVATDVGGGFSIGLGGLGFAIGISGSWLLFTGLVGAWMTAIIVVPRVKSIGDRLGWTTFPDFLAHRFDERTRRLAAVVSSIGYASFVGAQVLAGATLASGAFGIDKVTAVIGMAIIVIAYTALGGLAAVVFTDTIQWIVLLVGLAFVALPLSIIEAGGLSAIADALPDGHLSLTNVSVNEIATWAISIVPIWFVANTLYQRIYAARSEREARRAFYVAGLFEWPCMALLGTGLGVIAHVIFPELSHADRELALPMLIREVLPIGLAGIVVAAYLSAIMSTADSCLLASVGHIVKDFYVSWIHPAASEKSQLRVGRVGTVIVGVASVSVALLLPTVLEAILLTYSFMVSGLFVPAVAGLLWSRATALGATASMLVGGGLAIALQIGAIRELLPGSLESLDPAFIAIPCALVTMIVVSRALPARREVR